MAKNDLLAKQKISILLFLVILFISSCNTRNQKIRVAVAPYQDIAMIVNIKNLNLEEKYGTNVELFSMNWEDILPAVASAGNTVEMGFGSLTEYLTKYVNLNRNTDNPVLFIYPAYIYKGGGFMTFNKDITKINQDNIDSLALVKEFLSYKIGVQKNSIYEMIIYSLAKRAGVPFEEVSVYDIPLNEGFLAAQGKNPDIDITSAGLTQITEGLKHEGRLIMDIETAGFADITGFICKKNTYDKHKTDIDNVIRMWYECSAYVLSDIENNSVFSRQYLNEKAVTQYTMDQYKTALNQEFFPVSVDEAETQIISDNGMFPYSRISKDIIDYLHENGIVKDSIPQPSFINLSIPK